MAIYKNVEPLEVVRWTETGHHEYDEGFEDGVNFVLEKLDALSEEGVATEMADCVIRILDWFGAKGIDPEKVIAEKHDYNTKRPYRHGKKY